MRARGALLGVVALALVVVPAAGSKADDPTCGGAPATIRGTEGADTIFGTEGYDAIVGLGGDDVIYGGGGTDVICGGDGNDTIHGGDDRDNLWGEAGNDLITGGAGDDTLRGGPGNDVLDPGWGERSYQYGDEGKDRILLRQVEPGDGHIVNGGGGRDILDLRGVPLTELGGYGGVGVRLAPLPGGVGPIDCDWESGAIHCHFGESGGTVEGIEVVYGTAGNDRLWGDDRANLLRGHGGDDLIAGGSGDDRLLGGAGSDDIRGESDDDRLRGGAGDDVLNGDLGIDTAWGGAGDDVCSAETLFSCQL